MERTGFSIAYTSAADSAGLKNQSSKGRILSTFYYGYAFSQVPGGFASQKYGVRCVLLVFFLVWSLTCAFLPLDPDNVIILVIGRLLVGVAQGFIFPSIHTVLARCVLLLDKSRSVSLTTSGMYLGVAAGMFVLPTLVSFGGPRSVYLAEAALGTLWSLLWLNYAGGGDYPPRFEPLKDGGFRETKGKGENRGEEL